MSISLITDGMLYPIYPPPMRAPEGTEGVVNAIPTTPGGGEAIDSSLVPPATPVHTVASGPSVPTVPCGSTGYDPTINPPAVPQGPEASEDLGNESPAIPGDPKAT